MAELTIFENAEKAMNGLIEKIKASEYNNLRKGEFRKVKAEINPIWKPSVEQFYRIRPHSTTDYYPADLFHYLSPHRKNEEAEWIANNYEPVTLPVFMDFQSTLKRGFNPNNYKMIWEETPTEYENENNPQTYLSDGIKLFGSIHTWFSNLLPDVKIKDANGVICVKPYDVEYVTDGESIMIDSTQMIEPIPVYYSSPQIVAFDEDEYYLIMTNEKVKLSDNQMGFVFEWYDNSNIIRIEQYGKLTDWTFRYMVYFEHNWGATPVWKLKGQPEMKGSHIYFQSPFDFAVGNLNLSLKNHINKQMAEANGAWPHKIMIAQPCDNVGDDGQMCFSGHVSRKDRDTGEMVDGVCDACHGTGIKDKPSPGSTMLVDEEKLRNRTDNLGLNRITFVSPSPDILKHLAETVQINEDKARNILHIYSTNDQSSGTQDTATGKWIDNNAMIAFIMPIVNECYEIYQGVVDAIIYMRYGDTVKPPQILPPADFEYRTSDDLLAAYTSALSQNAPDVILIKWLEKYIERQFYASGEDKRVFKLILAADSLITKKNDEIRNMVGSGLVEKWRAILHANIFQYIEELSLDKTFFDKDIEIQKQALFEKAKAVANEIDATKTSPLDAILNNRVNPGQAV